MQKKLPPSPLRRDLLLEAAKKYTKQGFAILALEAADPKRPGSGKRPITPHGVKDATTDILEFMQMVEGRDDFNIGIATGPVSGLLVIDYDPRNGGKPAQNAILKSCGPFPIGPKVLTGGGGWHRYVQRPKGLDTNNFKLGPGIDIIADNGYVVAPPSMHASGKDYAWGEGRSLSDKPVPALDKLWVDKIRSKARPKAEPASKAATGAIADPVISEGQRNTTLTSVAGGLRAAGRSVSDIEVELQRINLARCQPPLGAAEVSKIVSNSERWAPAPGVGDPGPGERVLKVLLDRHYEGGNHIRHERDSSFYRFNGTHWAQVDPKTIQKQIASIVCTQFPAERKRLNGLMTEAMSLLRVFVSVANEDDLLHFVTDPPQVINVLNGELWLLSDGKVELRPHAPGTGMRHVLPVTYDADATCPEYDKAVAEIFSKASSPERVIKVWHQFMGFGIQPSRLRPMIVIMLGAGSNGKTKLIQTMSRLLGSDAVYSGDVARLETSPFGIGSLVGKLLFVDDDVKAGAKLPDGVLKKISEGKHISGERKHKDPFEFVCRALPVLLCNNVPSMADLSHGIRRRLKVLPFDRQFSEKEQDKTLFPRIWQNELPGVLNRALKGWHEFVVNGYELSQSKDIQKAGIEVLVRANPLVAYIDDRCEIGVSASTKVSELYTDFLAWSQEAGFNSPIVRNNLKGQLIALGYTVKKVQGYPYVVGLKLKKSKPVLG